MISVVLLSWQRTPSVRRICAQLEHCGLVDEVIVWNNNPGEHLELPGAKVRAINCSRDLGLFTRFAAASLARNPCILFHDDDLDAPEAVLNQLHVQWLRRPEVCHTLFGRNSSAAGHYTTDLAFGPVEIALTRYTMVHRNVCAHALAHTPRFADLPGVPVGNGEDIILSYAAMALSGRPNQAHRLPANELGQDAASIHLRYPAHIDHRTRIIGRCREVFAVRAVLWQHSLYRHGVRLARSGSRRLAATFLGQADQGGLPPRHAVAPVREEALRVRERAMVAPEDPGDSGAHQAQPGRRVQVQQPVSRPLGPEGDLGGSVSP